MRLGELHTWISTCSFSPQGLLGAAQKGENSWILGQIQQIHCPDLLVRVASLGLYRAQMMEWFGLGGTIKMIQTPSTIPG